MAARVHRLLGHRWQLNGQPVTKEDLRIAINQQSPIMQALDLIDTGNRQVWTIGPSGWSLLPRVTMLAEIWSREE